jgi:hypothetical protein
MNLAPHHADRCTEAFRDVTREALAAEQAPDTEAARKALIAVRDACLRAADTLNDAERDALEGALARNERRAA